MEPNLEMTGNPQRHAEFKFLVDLGAGPALGGDAGFEECRIGGVDMTAARLPPDKATEITLNRGGLDSDQLAGWLGGDRDQTRTVRVTLLSDDRETTIATWRLEHARIIRFVSRLADQTSTDLVVDELMVDELKLTGGPVELEPTE